MANWYAVRFLSRVVWGLVGHGHKNLLLHLRPCNSNLLLGHYGVAGDFVEVRLLNWLGLLEHRWVGRRLAFLPLFVSEPDINQLARDLFVDKLRCVLVVRHPLHRQYSDRLQCLAALSILYKDAASESIRQSLLLHRFASKNTAGLFKTKHFFNLPESLKNLL